MSITPQPRIGFDHKKMEDSLNQWIMKVEEQVNAIDQRVYEKPSG